LTRRGPAAAKINLALVVGPRGAGGKHELLTVYQRVALADELEVRSSDRVYVEGFREDTLVAQALEELAAAGGPTLAARIEKRIPVAAGLGGGSTDAAAALVLGNELSPAPVPLERLHEIACVLGADVPFFLREGPQLGADDGTSLTPLDLPQDYTVLLFLPDDATKTSTADVYAQFDERGGEQRFADRRDRLRESLDSVRRAEDLAALPRNDLVSSPAAAELRAAGAFRADVTGAGPAVYGLFRAKAAAEAAEQRLRGLGRTWITTPAW
jgi:4-diphosphocytidyl-2-C-methyl-D-erythritol kinase